jgi:hypothetical protein
VGKKNKWELGRKVILEPDLMDSDAFKKLSGAAIRVLLRFLRKRTWASQGRNKLPVWDNAGLVFTYAEAKALGICSTTRFFTILKQLVELGFLDVEHQGGAYGKDYSRYAFSERWKKYGTPEFIEVKKKRSLKGFPIQENLERKKLLLHKNEVVNFANVK